MRQKFNRGIKFERINNIISKHTLMRRINIKLTSERKFTCHYTYTNIVYLCHQCYCFVQKGCAHMEEFFCVLSLRSEFGRKIIYQYIKHTSVVLCNYCLSMSATKNVICALCDNPLSEFKK